jgi:hypothetical protein
MQEKIDDYRKYWAKIVEPDYKEFQASNGDLRKAFHCAGSLFHMADWLYWGNKAYIDANFSFKDKKAKTQPVTDERSFANALRGLHPDFELIRGIANAGKHLEIKPGRHPGAPVSAANTYVTATGFDQGTFDDATFDATPRVMQEGPNKQDVELTVLSKSVYDFWLDLCNKHGFRLG